MLRRGTPMPLTDSGKLLWIAIGVRRLKEAPNRRNHLLRQRTVPDAIQESSSFASGYCFARRPHLSEGSRVRKILSRNLLRPAAKPCGSGDMASGR